MCVDEGKKRDYQEGQERATGKKCTVPHSPLDSSLVVSNDFRLVPVHGSEKKKGISVSALQQRL